MDDEIRTIRRERWLREQYRRQREHPVAAYGHGEEDEEKKAEDAGAAQPNSGRRRRTGSGGDVGVSAGGASASEGRPPPARGASSTSGVGVGGTSTSRTGGVVDLTLSSSDDSADDTNNSSNEHDDDDSVEVLDPTCSPRIASATATARRRRPRPPQHHLPSSSTSSTPVLSSSFVLCTYNAWFGPHDGTPVHTRERMAQLASIVVSSGATFVGLQEVTAELWPYLVDPLSSAGYRLVCQDLRSSPYGCALAVRKGGSGGANGSAEVLDSGFLPYRRTVMGRGLLWVHVRLRGTEVFFGTTHLESYTGPESTGADARQDQIQQAARFCEQYVSRHPRVVAAFVAGDFNWDDERKRGRGGRPGTTSGGIDQRLLSVINGEGNGTGEGRRAIRRRCWVDAWRELRGDQDEGYTYDAKANPMLSGNLRRRFDRCLALLPLEDSRGDAGPLDVTATAKTTTMVNIESAILVGRDPIDGLVWRKQMRRWGGELTGEVRILPVLPSDHYGLVVTVGGEENEQRSGIVHRDGFGPDDSKLSKRRRGL